MSSDERSSKRRKLSVSAANATSEVAKEPDQYRALHSSVSCGDVAAEEHANFDDNTQVVAQGSERAEHANSPPLDTSEPRVRLPESHPMFTLAQSHPNLSKNQLKKLLRQQQWEAGRDDRKAKRKAETAVKKARKRAVRDDYLATNNITRAERAKALATQAIHNRGATLPITFLIDCNFDNLMSDGERTSLSGQITRCYSDNKRAKFRGHVVLSSFTGKLRARFDGILASNYKTWTQFRWNEADFTTVAKQAKQSMAASEARKLVGPFAKYLEAGSGHVEAALDAQIAPDRPSDHETTDKAPVESIGAPNSHGNKSEQAPEMAVAEARKEMLQSESEVVYLTSESPNTLTELKPYSTYIIGGLVDKNREKGICYKRACEAGVKTARLPIGEYLQMQSRKVLTTNHVLEIMLKWLEYEDWGKAFIEVMPKRKGGALKDDSAKNDKKGATEAEQSDLSRGLSDAVDDNDEESHDDNVSEVDDIGAEATAAISKAAVATSSHVGGSGTL